MEVGVDLKGGEQSLPFLFIRKQFYRRDVEFNFVLVAPIV